jgi:hypothetical protein
VLPLLQEKEKQGEVLIITGSPEVHDFFTTYMNYPVPQMKVHPNLITRTSKLMIIPRIFKAKWEFHTIFRNIKDTEIFFFGNSYSIVIFSYIQKLSKHNTIYHCSAPTKEASVIYPLHHGFLAYLMQWIALWLLGTETTVHSNQGILFWKLSPSYFTKNGIIEKVVSKQPSMKDVPAFDFLDQKEILITLQDLLVYDYVTKESFIAVHDKLLSLLESLAPQRYCIKPHPHESTVYGNMAENENIAQAYIPSEFFMDHPWKLIIGIFSTALLSASEMSHAKILSLIDLFTWKDIKKKEQWKKTMDNGKILFPQTVDQLTQEMKRVFE